MFHPQHGVCTLTGKNHINSCTYMYFIILMKYVIFLLHMPSSVICIITITLHDSSSLISDIILENLSSLFCIQHFMRFWWQ